MSTGLAYLAGAATASLGWIVASFAAARRLDRRRRRPDPIHTDREAR